MLVSYRCRFRSEIPFFGSAGCPAVAGGVDCERVFGCILEGFQAVDYRDGIAGWDTRAVVAV